MMAAAMEFMDSIHPPERVIRWLMRLLYAMAAIVITTVVARPFFTVGINLDHSLPGTVFLIHKGEMPKRGQVVAFRFQGYKPYFPAGAIFVKLLAGIPGDTVRATDHGCIQYSVNQTVIGCARAHARDGHSLNLGPVGMIPKGRYAVRGTSWDSFDSRYAGVGWIRKSQIIGRAYRLF